MTLEFNAENAHFVLAQRLNTKTFADYPVQTWPQSEKKTRGCMVPWLPGAATPVMSKKAPITDDQQRCPELQQWDGKIKVFFPNGNQHVRIDIDQGMYATANDAGSHTQGYAIAEVILI